MLKRQDAHLIGERSGPRAQHKGRDAGGKLTMLARRMRKIPTDAERRLWTCLSRKQLGYSFRRQHPMGKQYIADFICLEKKLIIELDGSQHAKSRKTYDALRTTFLEQEGYRVLRFWNNEVLQNIEGVCEMILRALKTPHASSSAFGLDSAAPPQGGSGSSPYAT